MKVYHGTTTWKMQSLLTGDFSKRFPGLFVTDTMKRATMYANTQAKQEVTQDATRLIGCAVVFVIEVEEEVRWMRRPESHRTLDKCEALIQRGRIVEIHIGRPGSLSRREHANIAQLQEQVINIPIHIFD